MLIIFLISFDSGQNKIGGHLKKVDRINIWLFHSGFQEGYQTLKMLTIIQSWLFALDVCRNVMTLYWYHSFKPMRSSDYAMPFVPQRLAAISAFWSYHDDHARRRWSLGGPLMCHHAPIVFYNRRHLRIYNFNSTFLVDVIGVKAFAYIFLHPLGWEEY